MATLLQRVKMVKDRVDPDEYKYWYEVARLVGRTYDEVIIQAGDARVDLEALENAHIECRAMGHQWIVSPLPFDGKLPMAAFELPEIFVCERCAMQRMDIINALGLVARRVYSAPDGYRLSGLQGPLYRSDFRVVMRRLLLLRWLKQYEGRA